MKKIDTRENRKRILAELKYLKLIPYILAALIASEAIYDALTNNLSMILKGMQTVLVVPFTFSVCLDKYRKSLIDKL